MTRETSASRKAATFGALMLLCLVVGVAVWFFVGVSATDEPAAEAIGERTAVDGATYFAADAGDDEPEVEESRDDVERPAEPESPAHAENQESDSATEPAAPGASVTGRVVDPAGEPVGGVPVGLVRMRVSRNQERDRSLPPPALSAELPQSTTESDGTFDISVRTPLRGRIAVVAQPREHFAAAMSDELFDSAGISVEERETTHAADLILKVCIECPSQAERLALILATHRRNRFDEFRTEKPKKIPKSSHGKIQKILESELAHYFHGNGRTRFCTVVVAPDTSESLLFAFLHGDTLRSMAIVNNEKSSRTSVRPERAALAYYNSRTGVLGVSCGVRNSSKAIRHILGDVLLGDKNAFRFSDVYSLKTIGDPDFELVSCEGVIEASLTEVEVKSPNHAKEKGVFRGDDLLKSTTWRKYQGDVMRAAFLMTYLEGKPRRLEVHAPERVFLDRDRDGEVAMRWLHANGLRTVEP